LPKLLDTTLREGELYKRFKREIRIRVVELLACTGVDRVELTIDYPPRTTREDVEAAVEVLKNYNVEIVLHGRAYRQDVEAAAKYDVEGVGVYLAPTELHRRFKLGGISFEEAKRRLEEALELASSYGFKYRRATIEDASRYYLGEDGGVEALAKLVDDLGKAGATVVSVPDTCGMLTPPQARDFFERLAALCRTPLSAHFHNDYGYASANTVEAALAGAEELHVSILGIGDRNGIADLYEVAASLIDVHGVDLRIRRGKLRELYEAFSKLTGIRIPFRHPLSKEAQTIRAGVHQSMALKAPEGYVPIGKLRYDFERLYFEATTYLSKKLIQKALKSDVDDEVLQEVSSMIAKLAEQKGGELRPREVTEALRSMNLEVDELALQKLLKPQKAYILLNLDPRFPVREKIPEILSWSEVDQVDEVYGDADLIIAAKLEDDVIERIKKLFGDAILRIRTLIAD
jgi:isopropylmalate/homocitrate/citramalate synthase